MNIFQAPDIQTSTDCCEVQMDGGYISDDSIHVISGRRRTIEELEISDRNR